MGATTVRVQDRGGLSNESGNRSMRVLFVEPVGERGGAESVLLDLVTRLDRSRVQPSVVCMREGPLVAELIHRGIPTAVIPTTRLRDPLNYIGAIARLWQLIRSQSFDVVVAYGTKAHGYA